MNRNKIKTNTDSIWLTVPVLRKGYRELKTSEIKINNSVGWQKKHLRSILINYKKTPYFEKYIPFFEDVYSKTWNYLTELNEYMLKWFIETLGINITFEKASDYDFEEYKDYVNLDQFSISYKSKNESMKIHVAIVIFGILLFLLLALFNKIYTDQKKLITNQPNHK